jgi:diguanylate cyclase (GGDEF)-like protein
MGDHMAASEKARAAAAPRLLEDAALVAEARRRRLRTPTARELGAASLVAGAFVAVAIGFALLADSSRPLDPVVTPLLCAAFALLSQLEFEVGSGSAVPTQLVFVPMLFALPLDLVPLLVAGSYALGGAADYMRGTFRPERALTLVGSAWFSLPAALVLQLAGEHAPSWSSWDVYLAALLLQFGGDFLHAAVHERLAHRLPVRAVVRPMLRVCLFDSLLSPVALLAAFAAPFGRLAFLALLPLVVVFVVLARERRARLDVALEAARLDTLANTDALTGVANRRAWEAELTRLTASGGGGPLTVCILDLDRFKAYNDAHGHAAGDLLLIQAADAWRKQLRANQLLARLGGEEFAVALPECDGEAAERVVRSLRAVVPAGETCSVGVACRQPGESAGALMRRADAALYHSKRSGRDRSTLAASG